MAVQQATIERPERGFSWLLAQSDASSVGIALLGALSFATVVLGALVVVTVQGWTPVLTLVASLKSDEFQTVVGLGALLGLAAAVLGWSMYARKPTKVSREECIAGAVLGLQALLLGSFLFWFVQGDVEVFARNYLDFKVIGPEIDAFINGARNTILLAVLGQTFGMILGLVFAVFAISKRPVVRAPARIYINVLRGTPLVWQIIFIGLGLPIGLGLDIEAYEAAVMALSLNTSAYAAEVFRAGIQSIERGQLEAARGLGMSYLQAMRYAVIPQALRRVIPPLLNEFVILIKDTSLVLVLGLTAADRELMSVGKFLNANTANATYLIATALGYLIVTLPLIRLVTWVERRMRSGLVGVGA